MKERTGRERLKRKREVKIKINCKRKRVENQSTDVDSTTEYVSTAPV